MSSAWWQPPPSPPCPDGWQTAPPDFVGVGAQRSGTTWWTALIADHPQVARMVTKELHFFDDFANSGPSPDVARQYARYFPRPPGRVAGEWTPRYMFDLWTPALLRRCAPDAKLLVLLRDPVERYRSHLARARKRAEQRGRSLSPALTNEAIARGRYWARPSGGAATCLPGDRSFGRVRMSTGSSSTRCSTAAWITAS